MARHFLTQKTSWLSPTARPLSPLWELTFDHGSHIPDRLLHRVTTSYAPEEGAVISTHHTELHVLGSPVEGADWLADNDGPSNDPDNHHRRGVVILDGQPVDSRRYAIDWEQVKDGVTFSGDPQDVRSYYSYGKQCWRLPMAALPPREMAFPRTFPVTAMRSTPQCPLRWKQWRATQSRSTWVAASSHITCICNREACG